MVTMAMSDEYSLERLMGDNCLDPGCQLASLFDRQRGVDKECFFVTGDERGGHVRPSLWNSKWQRLCRKERD